MICGDVKVLTDKGEIPVKDLTRGAAVYHVNHRRVQRTIMERLAQTTARTLVTLFVSDGAKMMSLTCTLTQRIAAGSRRPQAHKLRAGDKIHTLINGVECVSQLSAVRMDDSLRGDVMTYSPKFTDKRPKYVANGFICVAGA